ncbi:unnamed protein product [Allacma fusca]|uniref:Uncharacterized protein n=1 Tax=Allacma fusca TaxID=39272 RepID=A0A8J2KFP5_9HEXA|nr:unnamed protein product [Allacma fusca]
MGVSTKIFSVETSSAVAEVNNYVAQFRDLLIHIGQSRDGPEMREKIRRMRRLGIDSCRHAVHMLLQQVRSDISEGIPVDFSPQLVLLFFCTQLLLRELRKCRRLVMTMPIDMASYYGNPSKQSSVKIIL